MEISTSVVPYLPKEVVSEILSWMPVKSLLQFRTVCKSWQSIISNPHFIKIHSDRIASLKSMSIIVVNMHATTSVSLMYFTSLTDCANLQPPMPFVDISFITSCNGIVCLGNCSCDVISLWNPSTKQSKSLPRPPYISTIKRRKIHPFQFQFALGFCFDSVSNDYKVLRIVKENTTPVLAELYSTSADSWRKIQVHTKWSTLFGCGTVIKGVLYWISRNELVSFDVHNEVFRVFPFPSCLRGSNTSDILDFKGSVAFFISADGLINDCFSLWAMTDVYGKVSWGKQFTFKAAPKIDSIPIYLSTGQFVASRHFERLILYDYKKKETTNFQLSDPCFMYAVINHIESLVSIKGFEQVQYEERIDNQ